MKNNEENQIKGCPKCGSTSLFRDVDLTQKWNCREGALVFDQTFECEQPGHFYCSSCDEDVDVPDTVKLVQAEEQKDAK